MAGKLAEALVRAGVLAADAYDIEEELGLRKDNSVNLTATLSSGGNGKILAGGSELVLPRHISGIDSPLIVDGGTDTGIVRAGAWGNLLSGSSWAVSEGVDAEGFYVQAIYSGTGTGVFGAAFPTPLDISSGGGIDILYDIDIPGGIDAPNFTLQFTLSNNSTFSNSAARVSIFTTNGLIGNTKPGRNIFYSRLESSVTPGIDGSTATGYYKSEWSVAGSYSINSPITHMAINFLSGATAPAGTTIRLRPGGVRINCINIPGLIFGLDDGHKTSYQIYKYAASRGLRGVLPVVGSLVGKAGGYMTIDQALELKDLGFTPINHSYSHVSMKNFTYAQAYDEIARGKDWMLSVGLGDCPIFNYPGGYYNDNVIQAAQDLGYKLGRAAGKNSIRVLPAWGIENRFRLSSVDLGATTLVTAQNHLRRMQADAGNEIVWIYGHQVTEGNPAPDATPPADNNLWYRGWYRTWINEASEAIARGKIRPLSAAELAEYAR